MRAFLIYNKFFDEIKREPTVGGIQTYICDLCELFLKKSYTVTIVQRAKNNMEISWNGCTVQNVLTKSDSVNSFKKAVKSYLKKNLRTDDVVVFMSSTQSFPLNHKKTVVIQHGVYWDIPWNKPRANALIEFFFRNLHAWKDIKSVNQAQNCIAVDYNFLNWYKTQQYYLRTNIKIIPNYSGVLEEPIIRDNTGGKINILFARRFEKYRGTRIFSEAADSILKEFDNVYVTFAGDGPEKKYLTDHFANCDRVKFITYSSSDSLNVHSQYDIAVVASIGSEGTSLSLIEAMGAGCAVISTNVGGLTNIVIDGFNGLICDITPESVRDGLRTLIQNGDLRKQISKYGYETVKCAFSKENWQKKWSSVIDEL